MLFGLPGFRVRHVERDDFGSRTVHVQTDDETAAGCPSCGVVSRSVKGKVTTAPRDLPYGDDLISIVWHKQRWRCAEAGCARLSFTESVPEVPSRFRTTARLRRAAGRAVGDACRSVAEVASAFGLSWPAAHAAVIELAWRELGEPSPTAALGIDETRRGKPRWHQNADTGRWERTDAWDTGFTDLAGGQGLFGQVEGRTSACVVGWLEQRSLEFRAGIRFVAIDPAAVYAKAVRAPGLLPNAVLVVDHFHIVALANAAVTAVRRRVV